ncbi:ubiquinol-cytochrome c reductase iron-sulfur subunit [Leifsonia sp. YAF41]|uniref:QcrA and Rieske domain-containing protein n=1 Tax=Leifsonia sp. YAF41 TaxID=3233086 RepID=UPI003F9610B8
MTYLPGISRRTALVAGGVGSVALLAACAPTTTTPETGTANTPQPSGDASGSDGSAGSTGASVEVAKLSAIPVGGSISAELDGAPILLAQPVAGTVVAFSAICTHQGCVVLPAKTEFDCPCHGSRYDAATGEVLEGPAPAPLPQLTVTLDGDSVRAG